ncbi:10244_t:CDS:2 [Diversispora eburnea]|uniref:10244_t:CDS:1 n=1 Tax=Diversispora eburnea TaxID=1213867 RepID=A0A9N9AAG0_9GLOM|nr:10244_t:CDS:2 [Diversispora eburnea]
MPSDISDNEYVPDFEDSELDNTQETLINNNPENLNSEETSDIIDIPINEFEYGTKTSTSLLKEHLIKEYKYNVTIKQQTKLNFIKKLYSKDDVIRVKDYNDALLNLVIRYQLPFIIVNNKWFDEFCKTMDLRFTLPSQQYLQKQILDNFESRHIVITIKPLVELTVKLVVKLMVKPMAELMVKPTVELIAELTVELIVELTAEPMVELMIKPMVKPTVKMIVKLMVKPTVKLQLRNHGSVQLEGLTDDF